MSKAIINVVCAIYQKIRFFMRAEWVWMPPKKAEVLIYDREGSTLFRSYFATKNPAVLDIRGETLNIFVLFRTLITSSKGSFFFKYQTLYIQIVEPAVFLTFIDNNANFYYLQGKKNLVKIMVQNSYRSSETDTMGLFIKNNVVVDIDYVFVFGTAIGKKYAEYIRANFIPIGSFRNNLTAMTGQKSHTRLSRALIFISQYRALPNNPNHFEKNSSGMWLTWDDFYKAEKVLLPFLAKFAQDNKLDFFICGCQSGQLANSEKKYFQTILHDTQWEYLAKTSSYTSYEYVDSAKYIVFIDSTLGYEALAKGKRAASFSIRGNYIFVSDQTFGWPCKRDDVGFFWTNKVDIQSWTKIMNNIVQVSDVDWKIILKEQLDEIITYDAGNAKFAQLLDSLGVS